MEEHPPFTEKEDPYVFEQVHVHGVYETIAEHFSDTRHKPWPVVHRFLEALPKGSLGTDVGCGNGKYLDLFPGLFMVGNDRCQRLLSLAKERKRRSDFFLGDHLSLPFTAHTLVSWIGPVRSEVSTLPMLIGLCPFHCRHSSFFDPRTTFGCRL